jgi:hypothetical protein
VRNEGDSGTAGCEHRLEISIVTGRGGDYHSGIGSAIADLERLSSLRCWRGRASAVRSSLYRRSRGGERV